jgi:hypothetical protein
MSWKPAVKGQETQHSGEFGACSCHSSKCVRLALGSSRTIGELCVKIKRVWELDHGLTGTLPSLC